MTTPGIIFDFDGTIALSEHIHMDAWRDVARDRGRPLPADFDERGVGLTDRQLAREVAVFWGNAPLAPELLMAKQRNYQARCGREAILVPGVVAVLEHLGDHYPLGLATSAHAADIAPTMERFGLHRHFQAVVTIEGVTNAKPDPEIYLAVAARLGIDPAQSFAFEDSPAGAQAARAAGLQVFGMTTTFAAGGIGPVVDSLPDFLDIPRIMKGLGRPA